MTKYYYTDGKENFGPFTFEELKTKGITKETFVWNEHMDQWKKAGDVIELSGLFLQSSSFGSEGNVNQPQVTSPPPIPTQQQPVAPPAAAATPAYSSAASSSAARPDVLDAGATAGPRPIGRGTPPKTWLVESILVTLFCCMPLGIAAIVNASSVESKHNSGDMEGAKKASKNAGLFVKIAFFGGLVFGILYFFLIILAETGGF